LDLDPVHTPALPINFLKILINLVIEISLYCLGVSCNFSRLTAQDSVFNCCLIRGSWFS
jgi:hypothetical protein